MFLLSKFAEQLFLLVWFYFTIIIKEKSIAVREVLPPLLKVLLAYPVPLASAVPRSTAAQKERIAANYEALADYSDIILQWP